MLLEFSCTGIIENEKFFWIPKLQGLVFLAKASVKNITLTKVSRLAILFHEGRHAWFFQTPFPEDYKSPVRDGVEHK